MATTNTNLGMNPAKSLLDTTYVSNFQWYPIQRSAAYASSVYLGTPVSISGGYVILGTANAALMGAARAFTTFTSGGSGIVAPALYSGLVPSPILNYYAASTAFPTGVSAYTAIEVDPNTLYNMQANPTDNTSGIPFSDVALGYNFSAQTGFATGSGNTSSGFSTTQVGVKTAGGPIVIVNLGQQIGNFWATVSDNVLVKINKHQLYATGTAS